jgi:16S rRNA (cytidine1402-2'-O)-methyltransferase
MTGARAKTSGTLYVVATPIGNLKDLSPRARETLCAVEVVAAEDTRRIRGLLSSIGAQPTVIAYHEHNEDARAEQLVAQLQRGTDIALVSDAGMPLISDRVAARRCGTRGRIDVRSIPGRAPCSRRSRFAVCRRTGSYSRDSCHAALGNAPSSCSVWLRNVAPWCSSSPCTALPIR